MSGFLKGGAELQKLLDQLPAKMEANIVRAGMRAGANVLKEAIQEGAPVHLGDLKESVRVSTRLNKGAVSVKVKIGNKKAWYAGLVEFGTKPHEIVAGDGNSLFIRGIFKKSVQHPGARAHPFIRPALDANGQKAMGTMMDYMRNRLKTKHGLETPDSGGDDDS